MNEEKRPAWARCAKCGCRHIFTYLPMEAMKVVELMRRLSCAVCGNADASKFYLCDDPRAVLGEDK